MMVSLGWVSDREPEDPLLSEESSECGGIQWCGTPLTLRHIEFHLDEPTEEGDTLIRLLTNAPAEKVQFASLERRHTSGHLVRGAPQAGLAIRAE